MVKLQLGAMNPVVNEGHTAPNNKQDTKREKKEKQRDQKRRKESHTDQNIQPSSESIDSDENSCGESISSESVPDESRDCDIFASEKNDKVKPKKKATPFCWLCEYQGNRTTDEVLRFIMENIPHMTLDSLVSQSKYLLDRVDIGSDCSCTQIRTHIISHMLHPRIKLALQLQEMIKMQQEVSKCCVVDDLDTGGKTINPQAMKVYLTLCTQITGVYKIGEDKLTFNQGSADK